MRVLSVDLAFKSPGDLGIAVLRDGPKIEVELIPPQRLNLGAPLQPPALAEALIGLAEACECRWIALDGPSGWKHPDNGQAHSRVADKELNAPAKVGLPGQVKPAPYTAFVSFSVSVFDCLGERGYDRLTATSQVDDKTAVEIFPLVCWPRLGLPNLPAKAKCKKMPGSLANCASALSELVVFQSSPSHDELQATVAGVAVLWMTRGDSDRVHLAGRPPELLDGVWREGYIVAPAKKSSDHKAPAATPTNLFHPTPMGYYMERRGLGWNDQEHYCQKKLCFVATDQELLAEVLGDLAQRADCYYVKYSVRPRDGMYLGRCFLLEEEAIGTVWAQYKSHPRLMCTVQDDTFTLPYRR